MIPLFGHTIQQSTAHNAYLRKGWQNMTIEETLLAKFGPLMSVVALLRMYLRGNSEWAERINTTKVKVGRRLYFRTSELAQFLSGNAKQ
jgi:hypothetical protein